MKIPSYMKSKCPVLLVASLGGLFTVVNLVSAQSWQTTTTPELAWVSVASSADGNKLVAAVRTNGLGLIYTSTNSGSTWTASAAPNVRWTSVASSADGNKLVAAGFFHEIYTSTNSGATWTPTSAPVVHWKAVASSADGTKLVAIEDQDGGAGGEPIPDGPIYCSADSGTTWTETTAPIGDWVAVSSSADGTKLVAVAPGGLASVSGPMICTSTNSGVTWTQTTTPADCWSSVASSADGTKLVAASTWCPTVALGLIYTSTNSGVSWTQTTAPNNGWVAIASSADGSKLVAAPRYDFSGGSLLIYTSTNSGVTWTPADAGDPNYSGASWKSVASSADGNKLVAVIDYGFATSQTPPTPRLSLARSGGNLCLSWLVPSTTFLLQQNSDLRTTNWTDVPTLPALNFTNLHYEVNVSPTNRGNFYRLKQQ